MLARQNAQILLDGCKKEKACDAVQAWVDPALDSALKQKNNFRVLP